MGSVAATLARSNIIPKSIMIIGYYGTIPLETLTLLEGSQGFPFAKATPALGKPSLQAVGGDLKIYELTVYYPQQKVKWVAEWYRLAATRESYLLTFGGESKGRFVVGNTKEEFLLIKKQTEVVKLTIPLVEEGVFLWSGNYAPYSPPATVRKSAEGGLGGFLGGILEWLDKRF
jgi:hypothetical protein